VRYQHASEIKADLRRLSRNSDSRKAAGVELPGNSWSRKKIATLIFAAALIAAMIFVVGRSLFRRNAAQGISSIAVLPLENLSHDPEQDYFADGMTEELITDLSKINALRVISRTSVMQYKGVHKPLPQIAKELNVDAVVEGSVLRSGNRVRITAQLIHPPNDQHLWADSYDRDLSDVLTLQTEVAQAMPTKFKSRRQSRIM
jgi:TolB-like protein